MVIITVDGTHKPLESISIPKAQEIVGGYVEVVQLGNGKILLVDEEAKFKDKRINLEASHLVGTSIAGDVIRCTMKDLK
jgi:hypothetical protein